MKTFVPVLLLISFLATSCLQDPELTVPEEKMVVILADIHLAEAASHRLYGEVKDSVLDQYYEQIYQLHGVQEEVFLDNLDLLYQHPNMLEPIYERVLERLKELEARDK